MHRAQVRLEGATDLEAGAGALARRLPRAARRAPRAPRLSADALEPLFGLGRLQGLVLVTCPNVGDALLEDLDELSEDRWLPLRRLELAGTRRQPPRRSPGVEATLTPRGSTTVEPAARELRDFGGATTVAARRVGAVGSSGAWVVETAAAVWGGAEGVVCNKTRSAKLATQVVEIGGEVQRHEARHRDKPQNQRRQQAPDGPQPRLTKSRRGAPAPSSSG